MTVQAETNGRPTTEEFVQYEVTDGVATIWLNRPEVKNCVNWGLLTQLGAALERAIAADDAKIGDFHIRRALFGGAGPIYRLPRYIGLRKTKELLFTGKLLSGKECEEWGLANVSAPTDQLEQAIADFVAPMKDKSAFTMRITKLAANRGLDGDTETLIALESMTCNVAHQSEDAREGVQAFLEKREPVWKHR